MPHTAVALAQAAADPRSLPVLYVLSPLPPQRNGLADYIVEYLPLLARHYRVQAVAEAAWADQARTALRLMPGVEVLDEAQFLARQPLSGGLILYNLGNNGDCAWMLDYLHRLPGAVLVHDISLFYLHQAAAERAQAHALLGAWLIQDGYHLPDDFLRRDGSVARTPGTVYQECLMLRRIAASARGLMVHTAYAERRLRGAVVGLPLGQAQGRPLLRLPHFVLTPPPIGTELRDQVLARFGISDDDFLLLLPGFLSGNKMLYEVLVAFHALAPRLPGLRLLFAGEERPQEYDLSARIALLWPDGDGPQVSGYLSAEELDVLLGRADLSFVLRFPTYGESSGILPRAAMGGGAVVTVDIGAYPEFDSPSVLTVPVGAAAVPALIAAVERAWTSRAAAAERGQRQADEARRAERLQPAALLPALLDWLQQSAAAPAGLRRP